ADAVDIVPTHRALTERARQRTPSALHVSVDDFMASPRYDEVVELIGRSRGEETAAESALPTETVPTTEVPADEQPGPQDRAAAEAPSEGLLARESIVLEGEATTMAEAITEAGRLLVAAGAVPEEYVDSMHEREESVSTHMGNGLAIPHGTNEAKGLIRRTAISFVRYPSGLDWNGKETEFVIGI